MWRHLATCAAAWRLHSLGMDRVVDLYKQLQAIREGAGINDPKLPNRARRELREALQIDSGVTDGELRGLLEERLLPFINDVQDEQERIATLVSYRLHPDYQQETTSGRREALARKWHISPHTVRRHREDKAFLDIAARLVKETRQPNPAEEISNEEDTHPELNQDGQAALKKPSQEEGPTLFLPIYETRSHYILNGRPLWKPILWLFVASLFLIVAYFAFLGGGYFGSSSLFDDWSATANSVDVIPIDGDGVRVTSNDGRLDIHWPALVGRPGQESLQTLFKPGNSKANLTHIEGELQLDQSSQAPCPNATIAWSISVNGKTIASGSLGRANPTDQLAIPIDDYHLDAFAFSARLAGNTLCPYMGLIWRDPHIAINNRE